MATITMIPFQKVVLAAVATKSGIAAVTGIPAWTTSDSTLVALTPSSDGKTCEVKSKGPTGSCTVTCTALGATSLNANHTITIAAATTNLATALSITAQGPPTF